MSMNEFPQMVFVQNKNDARIQFSLGDNHNLENASDIFFFFVDLLIKGIILLFGGGERSVVIGNLTAEDIGLLKRKFANIGVTLSIDMVPNLEAATDENRRITYELADPDAAGEPLLESYRMKLVDVAFTYFVHFKFA